jgi:hypothetical protein
MAKTQLPASQMLDGSIKDADIASDAAIATSKLALVKAAGSDITTGTDDAKYVTAKAIKDAGIVALSLSRVNKTQADSPYTVTAADCAGSKLFTNTGASAECRLNLPAGTNGYRINLLVTAAQDFTCLTYGGETIRFLATISKAGGKIKANVIGHLLQLDWSGTQWVASAVGLFWQLETS